METDKSKTIVYSNGDILTYDNVKEILFRYWKLTAAEKRATDRLIIKYPVCPDKWKELFEALNDIT